MADNGVKRKLEDTLTDEDSKKLKLGPKAITAVNLASISRAKRNSEQTHRRSRSPSRTAYDRRERPVKKRTPSPPAIQRSPPGDSSPPRQRKLPGAKARVGNDEALRLRHQEQGTGQFKRGVHDVVRQHYNAVPQRGVDWRRTESRIKGLRSLNNWIKSAIIHKFSPGHSDRGLLVLDIGCGKGGDLQKWYAGPQIVELYVGLDPAEISIGQARGRYQEMRRGRRPLFQAEFDVRDCYGTWIGDVPIVRRVGIDGNVGPNGDAHLARWGGGGFDVVSMMFCMHYAFEDETRARNMLRNVAGSLKKGGRFIGVIPNSDIIIAKIAEFNSKRGINVESDDDWDPEKPSEPHEKAHSVSAADEALEWGNDIYKVRIPYAANLPTDGVFRPPFGWKYSYFLEEAVEEIPEYIVPWEAFRAMAVDYDLELQYKKSFPDIWQEERNDPVLGPLSQRMGVVDGPNLKVTESEFEAAGFYVAFSFYKV